MRQQEAVSNELELRAFLFMNYLFIDKL